MSSEPWTIKRLLDWATNDFRARGFDSPRLDAELLLAEATGRERVRLIVESGTELSPNELGAVRELIQRRRRAEPIAYILGEREFYGLSFKVDARVLVPRPDTETLVDVALRMTEARSEFGVALDVCTGSGCVAIAFKKQRPTWRVTASDISEDALCVARGNAERLGTAFGMNFVRSDLFAALDPAQRYSLITANVPYIPESEIATLQADVRDFEPRIALSGGNDGLEIVRRVVEGAPRFLGPAGVLAMEIGHDQADRCRALFSKVGFTAVDTASDYAGHQRVIMGRWLPEP